MNTEAAAPPAAASLGFCDFCCCPGPTLWGKAAKKASSRVFFWHWPRAPRVRPKNEFKHATCASEPDTPLPPPSHQSPAPRLPPPHLRASYVVPAPMAAVAVRPLEEAEVDAAERIMRAAFGQQLGLADPSAFMGDAVLVRCRFPNVQGVPRRCRVGPCHYFQVCVCACDR